MIFGGLPIMRTYRILWAIRRIVHSVKRMAGLEMDIWLLRRHCTITMVLQCTRSGWRTTVMSNNQMVYCLILFRQVDGGMVQQTVWIGRVLSRLFLGKFTSFMGTVRDRKSTRLNSSHVK